MDNATPQTIHLADYTPYSHLIERVELVFRLAPLATRVLAKLHLAPNPAAAALDQMRLDGENLKLISCTVDGQPRKALPDATGLTLTNLPERAFVLETEVEIAPESNTALEGLYMSRGMYCTQCEAEGFRKITFYPDRPDVMSRFHVRIESQMPVLLSNGNVVGVGQGWAEWDDPWPKPAYLFALVAGDLVAHSDHFSTASGRNVDLNIWVRKGDENRCAYAMDALKRSMRWDETEYGREYDLDIFNIVAVDDFNMGAMENKGLNIFNSRYVLASSDTATDDDFARIEAIIAHEYFHNWTGNRITCRDWFQLCLKEGLTVFRDQQFSGDMRNHAVKRIEDVIMLRARQFREDSGPLAHPVRPDNYVEINNFYTATVYEKGAEVIGMLKRLVGDENYAAALNLYFARHDGEAATIEDWLKVFEDVTGRDLSQFKRWYTEAGTPRIKVYEAWTPGPVGGTYTLTLAQTNPPTPGQSEKGAKVIPVAVGLLNPNGDEVVPTTVLELTQPVQSFSFDGLAVRPIASILRGFSAPITLEREVPLTQSAFLLAHDTDDFNRWEAGRTLSKAVLCRMVADGVAPMPDYLDGVARLATDTSLDPAFRALALRLPAEDDIAATLAAAGRVPDPSAIYMQRQVLHSALAHRLAPDLEALLTSCQVQGPYSPASIEAGKRALGLTVLGLMSQLDSGAAARALYRKADNMTEAFGAIAVLVERGQAEGELADFAAKWAEDRLVMDKWFSVQVAMSSPDRLAETVNTLTSRPDFDWKNPNRFRSVIGALSGNHAGFHHSSGSGYRLLADWLIRLDPVNPQTAARMSTAYETRLRYDADRQEIMREELQRIGAQPSLSRDLSEMVTRMLAN